MDSLIPTVIFYLFSTITVLSALRVISAKNPVHSVLFLILAFFSSAGLFVLIGAEYLAMTLVIVYVGAVAVLFLFVVMMLDIDIAQLRSGFLKYLPMGITVALIVFFELFVVICLSIQSPSALAPLEQPIPAVKDVSNTKAIGNVLYTYYVLPFQMSGIILLIAMIGAIVLTLRSRRGVRKQNIEKQLARSPADAMKVVKVKSGEGIA